LAAARSVIDRYWDCALERFEHAARKEMFMSTKTIEPVRKQVRVPLSPEDAFVLLTRRMG
jgi:hypothetical protein